MRYLHFMLRVCACVLVCKCVFEMIAYLVLLVYAISCCSYDNSWDSRVKQRSGWADHSSDDRNGASSTRMKGRHYRGLMAFERLIHPFTLMAVGTVGGLIYLGMSSMEKNKKTVNNGVSAW